MVTKEIGKLRSSIQIVCRSALPLGKIMDYIQEDMDTMKNELQMWRKENAEHAEVLLREQRYLSYSLAILYMLTSNASYTIELHLTLCAQSWEVLPLLPYIKK